MATRAILLVVLAGFFLPAMVHADDMPTFIGSRMKTEDAIAKSNTIIVGKITKVGPVVLAAPNESYYPEVEVVVLKTLKGLENGQVTVTLDRHYPEQAPKLGNSDIFFINGVTTLKLLPATDANIIALKKLIAELPAK